RRASGGPRDARRGESVTMATIEAPKFIGARIRRKEDPRLITGGATYTDDLNPRRLAIAHFVRSPEAHARIIAIDATAARQMPGVVAVFTSKDLQGKVAPLPVAHRMEDLKEPEHPALATDRVRFAGEPVAVVVAESAAEAVDAAEQVEVDYDSLPVITDIIAATSDDSPLVHEEIGTNVAFTMPLLAGDPDAAFETAAVNLSQRIVNQRQIPIAMEPRSVVADYDRGHEKLTVWSSTQVPHLLRTLLSGVLSMTESKVRLIAPEVGGGFGSKLNFYAEEAVVAWLATRLTRPIKWTGTRTEDILATIHGRDQLCDLQIAADEAGRLLALRAKLYQDLGAYHQLLTPVIPTLTMLMLGGCYTVRNLDLELRGVFTNKTPTDAYRGAGRPEATYIIERAMDLIAGAVGKDPVEVRRLNFPPADAFPYATATEVEYDSGNYQLSLDRLLEISDYEGLRRQQQERRQAGELVGIGLSTYVEVCGVGPSAAMPAGGWEACELEVRRSGKIVVKTGISPHGQGEETTFAQIAADRLGLTPEDVEVVHGDTDTVAEGIGTFGSRGLAVGGTALVKCLETVREKAKRIGAHLLEASHEDMVFEDGKLHPKGVPGKSLQFQEIIDAAYLADQLPPEIEPGLMATHFYEPPNFTYPFGAHLALVDIDRGTGQVNLRRYIAVDDCGRVINPMIVDGQIHGGIAQGVAQSLYEHAIYDDNGQLMTGSLMHYPVPKAEFLPSFELDRTETPTPVNPLGAKGVGEAGTIASSAAIINAVVDALSPFGVKHLDMPATPERVWRLMQGGAR
ncbi:MAG: xanthine dehydrogenase family protein molybdopterin-binding subunit, partial [Acidobacteriota bacterium]